MNFHIFTIMKFKYMFHVFMCSAPDIDFQQQMHELVEGLSGTEVVADDFVVAGLGDT